MDDRYYPLFVKGHTLRALVVGGGNVAARKVGSLLAAGAKITLVSPEIVPALAEAAESHKIRWIAERYDGRFIENVQLVIGATDDTSVNARIADDAHIKGIPVNIVDDPVLSTVIMPSVMNSGPLTVAVGTSGAAPELARKIREEIENFLPDSYPIILGELKALRPRIKRLTKDIKRDFWRQVTSLDVLKFTGDATTLVAHIRGLLGSCEKPTAAGAAFTGPPLQKPGKVFLVGAGPGDPGLLTLKGRECLRIADVVIYDHLADASLLSHVPERCEKIFVGKSASRHIKEQDAINAIMVEKAGQRNIVVRLKGGDPFIFGRGGEECEVLREAGISYEVVPGVTSGIAAPAYAGIPLTFRGVASSVAFVTGHREKKASPQIRWEHLAESADTLVFFMGVTNLPQIANELIAHGKAPLTPACVIQWGTKQDQKTVVGTLSNILKLVEEASLQPPAIIVVGEVVRLRDKLQWFERLQNSPTMPPG